ncbi:hypothetical protein BC629DRAFT_1482624 [Irpex lacteus]|nr:hypothetical protein BC629DRAFT_1482624 [Irpex lacteus]
MVHHSEWQFIALNRLKDSLRSEEPARWRASPCNVSPSPSLVLWVCLGIFASGIPAVH